MWATPLPAHQVGWLVGFNTYLYTLADSWIQQTITKDKPALDNGVLRKQLLIHLSFKNA